MRYRYVNYLRPRLGEFWCRRGGERSRITIITCRRCSDSGPGCRRYLEELLGDARRTLKGLERQTAPSKIRKEEG